MDKKLQQLKVTEVALQIAHDQMEMAVDSNYDFRMMGDEVDEKQQLEMFKTQLQELKRQRVAMEKVIELVDFKNHMDDSTDEMLDNQDEANEKYDYIITMNGQSVVIPNNADFYDGLKQLIMDEIDERTDD